ncbi:MAG TPA: carboxymuconolactone decarboxylase family protein [Gaiellaceae bacterium]|nr:carboxymuconolactone decarboxylase family protein [Gaiellaceae bacterium]
MEIPVRLDFDSHAPAFSAAMSRLDRAAREELERVGFDRRLAELVRIRASQLNGCAYCIDMHTKDAKAAGESEQRIYALSAWHDAPFFDERERAALAFTEAVTLMADGHVPEEEWEAVAGHYSEDELGALVSLLVAINAWNAIGVSTHAWVPGSYEP